jgi:MFS family permease
MLKKFSLYGFLKNQQYYDPFLLLALRQMGLSYTWYGILVAFREISVNILEAPSGAVADLFGRRKSMISSFISYIISFSVFGFAGLAASKGNITAYILKPLLLMAMFFFAVGDAFRTGTHKAMIFSWLRINNRTNERTKVYGYTRSWSKLGSAFSVVLACVFVFFSNNFIYIFFFSIIPYVLNIINFIGYPKELDVSNEEKISVKDIFSHLRDSFIITTKKKSLRRLVFESMGFGGFFKACKDYLQPVLMTAAAALTVRLFSSYSDSFSDIQRSIILYGPVFFVLYLLSAFASRKSHCVVDYYKNETNAARALWVFLLLIFTAMLPAIYFGLHWVVIVGFVMLYMIQNFWRPVLVSRFDSHSEESKGATVLSIESQAKSFSTMIFAPLLGFAIDTVKGSAVLTAEGSELLPLGVIGFLLALGFLVTSKKE